MLDRGFNPCVVNYMGNCMVEAEDVPIPKSIYFSIEPLGCFCHEKKCTELCKPWFYQNGIFDGQFEEVVGRGASGVVLRGFFNGNEVAFKFVKTPVKIRGGYYSGSIEDAIADLNKQLREMRSLRKTSGSKIVQFYGHYR